MKKPDKYKYESMLKKLKAARLSSSTVSPDLSSEKEIRPKSNKKKILQLRTNFRKLPNIDTK